MPSALSNRSSSAAFLCYHSIARDGPAFLSVPPERFERQLARLRRDGWQGGGRDELELLAGGGRPHAPLAFLTFDDGYRDNFTEALPLLEAYGFKALVFVIPPYLDDGGRMEWPEVAADGQEHPELMRSLDWTMAERMAAGGVEFGSHTCRHPDLRRLPDDQLAQELLDSRRRIEQRLGRCDSIAYPFGLSDQRVQRAAAAAGYRFGFTLPYGSQRDATPLSIPRVAVDHRDGEVRFRLKLTGPYRSLLLSPAKVWLRKLKGGGASRVPSGD